MARFDLKSLSRLAKVPRFAKILIPLQTLLNLVLVLWIYEEYVNNRYFREYVSSSLQAGVVAAIVLGSIGLLVIIAVGLYAKLRGYRRELRLILSTETFGPREEGLVTGADPGVEKKSFETLQKTTPVILRPVFGSSLEDRLFRMIPSDQCCSRFGKKYLIIGFAGHVLPI